jgi:hypothetical protein
MTAVLLQTHGITVIERNKGKKIKLREVRVRDV